MNKKNQINVNNSNNNPKNANQRKEFIPDSEDAEITDIEIVQKQKKIQNQKKIKNKRGIVTTTHIPNDSKKLKIKEEDKEVIEFVLGDFFNYHKVTELNTFKNMTSLTLVYESIKNISDIVDNLPNPASLKYLCLNENLLTNLYGVEKLVNIEELQVNFNQIEKIENITELNSLQKFWISENKIQIIENLPISIVNFWAANNLIQNIPEDFDKYTKLEFINLSGNFISDLKDIFILEKLKSLKKLYLTDINFGENPICQYTNYRQILIHIFKDLECLDQVIISPNERQYVENLYIKRNLLYNNKIRQNHKTNKMIFQMMKAYKFFLTNMKYHQVRFFSQRQKMLEYAKYEKLILGIKNETSINDIDKEIEASKNKEESCLKICEYMNGLFRSLKKYISNINDLYIVTNFYDLESNGNFKIEPGNLEQKWVKSCQDLMKSRLPSSFLTNNKYKDLSLYEIYKVTNKKVKFLFESIYDNLVDQMKKFGKDHKFLDFFFLLLPKDILFDPRKLMSFLFEESYDDKEFILCDNFSFLDEQKINSNENNNNFIVVICKCAYFEEMIEEIKGEDMSLSSLDEIKEYLKNKAKNIDGKIVKLNLKMKNTNFYYFNIKGIVAPEFIVQYNYVKDTGNEENVENNENGIVSSFQYDLKMNNDYETIFNLSTKHLYNQALNPKQFFCKESINKNLCIKLFDFKELENHFLFFIKNSVITFFNNCFKYQTHQDYLNEINKINEKINELSELKFLSNYILMLNKYLDKIAKNKNNIDNEEKKVEENNNDEIKWEKIKLINLFNLDLTNDSFEELLNKIKSASIDNSDILNMTKNCESLFLCKNKIDKLDLNKILEIFPNLLHLDVSHNNISTIIFNNSNDNDTKYSLSSINISYNNISDFNNIITLLKNFENLSEFIFFSNPYQREFEYLTENPTKTSISSEEKENIIKTYNDVIKNKNKKEMTINISEDITKINNANKNFDYIYDCFSFSDKYHSFSDNIYFREKIHNESSYRTVILSKKKLFCIPTIENGSNTQVLYINLNKISKISNLGQFTELIELYIQNNKIKKIENLPESIKKLDISNNDISDLAGIEKSINLEWFNFENNNIKSISRIIKLINIKEIYCAGNYINNIKECSQLGKLKKLELIDLTGNEVCRKVKDLRITMIYYCKLLKSFNRINVDPQERVKAKEYFTGKLTAEVLEKKLGVGYSTYNLVELDLSSLKLKDENNIFNKELYPKLTKLNISRNIFKSFSIFGNLPYLAELNLNYNLFTEILPKKTKIMNGNGIFGLPNLESLELAGNQIANLNGIQFFKKLKILVLRENSLSKIDCINNMDYLTFLDVSFNKLRNCDRSSIGILPSLQVFLCDNNYLKYINDFDKFYSIQILSFENNKIPDYNSLEKLAALVYLKDLSIANNPVTKSINYRNSIIRMFPNLLKLDGRPITNEEKEMIAMEMQMDGNNNDDDGYEVYEGGYGGNFMVQKKLISANYNYNIQRMQDKALKRVNFVQLGYMMPVSLPNIAYSFNPFIRGSMEQNSKNILPINKKSSNNNTSVTKFSLPQIKTSINNNNEPIQSESNKRMYRGNSNLNCPISNLTNNNINGNINNNNINNINNYTNNFNVKIINKNIPPIKTHNRAGSIQPIGRGINPLTQKPDFNGVQANSIANLTNNFGPILNIEKIKPVKSGKNLQISKNGK